ncbi:hypothetical protein D3C81_1784770 [compost metagenome]
MSRSTVGDSIIRERMVAPGRSHCGYCGYQLMFFGIHTVTRISRLCLGTRTRGTIALESPMGSSSTLACQSPDSLATARQLKHKAPMVNSRVSITVPPAGNGPAFAGGRAP